MTCEGSRCEKLRELGCRVGLLLQFVSPWPGWFAFSPNGDPVLILAGADGCVVSNGCRFLRGLLWQAGLRQAKQAAEDGGRCLTELPRVRTEVCVNVLFYFYGSHVLHKGVVDGMSTGGRSPAQWKQAGRLQGGLAVLGRRWGWRPDGAQRWASVGAGIDGGRTKGELVARLEDQGVHRELAPNL